MELSVITEIGKIKYDELINKNKGSVLDLFIENPNEKGVYNKIIEVTIDRSFNYIGLNISEFKKDYISKYLYKKGSTNGTDFTPTARLTEPKKTFINKIIKCYEETIETYHEHSEIDVIKNIYNTLKNHEKDIINQINNVVNSKEGFIITVVYDNRYIGDFEIFKDKLKREAIMSYYLIDKKESKGVDKRCSLCKEEKGEVYGNANIFKFYTVDKRGYVAGGFNKLDSWRNFPVCEECAIFLELGKRFLDENLSFKFQGRDFYLIPKSLYKREYEKILNILIKMKEEPDREYVKTEDRLLRKLSKIGDYVTFDLLFYEVNNSALNIKLDIQEVLPSRFRKIFEELDKINYLIKTSKNSENITVDFKALNILFPRKNYNRYFLELVDIIISDKEVDYKFIIQHVTNHIIENFNSNDGKYFYYNTILLYGFILYLRILGVLFKENGQVKLMEKFIWDIKDYTSKEELFEDFFSKNLDFFTTSDKKAVFLIGFLSQKLLNLQYALEERTPFQNRLKGLKLGKRDIKRLLPEIHNKFIEYDKNYYPDILALASHHLIKAGDNWSITELDIPFYFSLGMNLEKHIKLSSSGEEE